jgi:hypothetical protein
LFRYNPDAAVASTFVRLWLGAAAPRPPVAVVFDLAGHSDWRCSVLAWRAPFVRNLSSLADAELLQLCKDKRLVASGSKQELIDRLVASDSGELLFGHLRCCPLLHCVRARHECNCPLYPQIRLHTFQ